MRLNFFCGVIGLCLWLPAGFHVGLGFFAVCLWGRDERMIANQRFLTYGTGLKGPWPNG